MNRAKLDKYLQLKWPKNWPYDSIAQRLPRHYLLRKLDCELRKPIPVHWIPQEQRYQKNKYHQNQFVKNDPIKSFCPPLADKGLWGGEEVIKGYKTNRYERIPNVWVPMIHQRIFYSQLLDKHMIIQCTKRTEDLVDQHYGFDHYILNTHLVDLKSQLGAQLKREMLMKLISQPNNSENANYMHYIQTNDVLNMEEAEWFGLSWSEAYAKQLELEKSKLPAITPLKNIYMKEILQHILSMNPKTSKVLSSS